MRPLAETASHARSQRNAGFAKFVAQAVGRSQRVFPALLSVGIQQINLLRLGFKRRRLHAEQAHFPARLPVFAKKFTHLFEYFAVELRRGSQTMGSRNCCEIFVTQLELDGARVELTFAQSPADHFRKPHQRSFQLVDVRGIFVVSVLVADGFRCRVGAHFRVEPSTRVFTASLARQRQAPLAESLFKLNFFQPREVSDFLDAKRMQMTLHHLANAGNLAHIQRRKKLSLLLPEQSTARR